MDNLLVLQNFTIARKSRFFYILKVLFSSDTRQSMKRRITTERRAEIFLLCFGSPFGCYPTFHNLTSVGRKQYFQYVKESAFSCNSYLKILNFIDLFMM